MENETLEALGAEFERADAAFKSESMRSGYRADLEWAANAARSRWLEAVRARACECASFVWANRALLRASGQPPEQSGHDFWLTRNGHGAGFWDRGLGEIGTELTRASKPYGSCDLYVGEDGRVYAS